MNMSIGHIERVTAERLRQLPIGDIYSMEVIEDLEEGDEISATEAWFMMGYLDG